MPNPIPTVKSEAVRKREGGRCIRCGMNGAEHHHRRTRRVADEHQHSTCNLIRLCHTCHLWVHAQPLLAMRDGMWISRHEASPCAWPVRRWDGQVVFLDHAGNYTKGYL